MSQSEPVGESALPDLRESAHARSIIAAARRLVLIKGSGFTTKEIVQESGVALKTFYRYFASKDLLLLAVIGDITAESCAGYDEATRDVSDPIARLRYYLTSVVLSAFGDGADRAGSWFITSEHWRLSSLYPEELTAAVAPFTQLILRDMLAAQDAGRLPRRSPPYDAWLLTQLAIAVHHDHATRRSAEDAKSIADTFWAFCLAAMGGIQSPLKKRR